MSCHQRPFGVLRSAFLILGAWLLSACGEDAAETKTSLNVFGTMVELTIRGVDTETAEHAVAELSADFRRMHKDWHAWKPGGELGKLNKALREGRALEVSPFLLPLVHRAKIFHEQSEGLFNPAIGGLVSIWGFHADDRPKGRIPDKAAIRRLVEADPTMDDVRIEGARVSSANTAVHFDFGGFAKGAALDRAAARLKEMGIENAILNAGGDINVLGRHGNRPWRAGIRHPRHWGVIATIELNGGEGLYTSGNYERYREYEGVRYTHIIDPRDGMPVNHIVSATVIHPDGALADAAATALSVAGPSDWVRIARRMGVVYVMLIDENGAVYMTREMQRRIVFKGDPPDDIFVAPDRADG